MNRRQLLTGIAAAALAPALPALPPLRKPILALDVALEPSRTAVLFTYEDVSASLVQYGAVIIQRTREFDDMINAHLLELMVEWPDIVKSEM